MLKPRVGEMVFMSSPLKDFSMVVLPALSRPRIRRRHSRSFDFTLRIIERRPIWLIGGKEREKSWGRGRDRREEDEEEAGEEDGDDGDDGDAGDEEEVEWRKFEYFVGFTADLNV